MLFEIAGRPIIVQCRRFTLDYRLFQDLFVIVPIDLKETLISFDHSFLLVGRRLPDLSIFTLEIPFSLALH
jgi:hypothetical protein